MTGGRAGGLRDRMLSATAGVAFTAWVRDSALMPKVERRLRALAGFYAPLGFTQAASRRDDGLGLMLGALSGSGGREDIDAGLLVWGEPLPAGLAGTQQLIEADPALLRTLHGTTCAVALEKDAGRIVTAPTGPTVLYEASSDDVTVWSTHAVAAGWLARGSATIDEEAIPELMAFDFVGGRRTLLRGVAPVPPATSVRFDARGPCAESWWPASARWQRVREDEAQSVAEGALLATLDARLRGEADISLGLTAGVDSRVTALAVLELGLPLKTFTWGEPNWPDSVGGRAVADALGTEHALFPPNWFGDQEVVEAHERAVRFGDGVAPFPEADRRWPSGNGPIVGGFAGETGRAYYYDTWATYLGLRSPRDLVASLGVRRRLSGANRDAVLCAERALRAWVEEAVAIAGLDFRALDVLYT